MSSKKKFLEELEKLAKQTAGSAAEATKKAKSTASSIVSKHKPAEKKESKITGSWLLNSTPRNTTLETISEKVHGEESKLDLLALRREKDKEIFGQHLNAEGKAELDENLPTFTPLNYKTAISELVEMDKERKQKEAEEAQKAYEKRTKHYYDLGNGYWMNKSTGSIVDDNNERIATMDEIGTIRTDDGIVLGRVQEDGTVKFREIGFEKYQDRANTWLQLGAFEDGYQVGDVTKTILGTGRELGKGAVKGLVNIGETAVDGLSYLAGGAAIGLYDMMTPKSHEEFVDLLREGLADTIKADVINEDAIANFIVPDLLEKVTGETSRENAIVGDKAVGMAESAGQLAGQALLQGVGIPWWVTSAVTSFGGEVESALNQGATFGEAGLSAAITAGAEVLTEKLFGAFKIHGKGADDALKTFVKANIGNKMLRFFANLGIDIVGEGSEEVLSGFLSALGKKLTYADDKKIKEMFSSEDAFDAWLGGAILGGGSTAANAVKSMAKGVDAVTGLTKNEQLVVDKVYKDEVAKAKKNGEKLSMGAKNKIYDSVKQALEKGYIATDTIEEVLGGETYAKYKDIIDSEEAALKELESLYEGEELEQQIQDLFANSERTKIRGQLGVEVSKKVKGDRLIESYKERIRRKQKFTADLTKYSGDRQRSIVQKAIDSGVLNNTNRSHELVDLVAKIAEDKDIDFDFTNNEKLKASGFALDGKTVNGYLSNSGIAVNVQSNKALNSIVGHEISHVLEGTEMYSDLQKVAFEYAKMKGEYKERLKAARALYKDVEGYQGVEGFKKIKGEVLADIIGDYIFTDQEFINNLSANHRNVFQKAWDEIKYLHKIATAGSKEARELEKVKKAFEVAYRASANNNSAGNNGTKYSVHRDIVDVNGKEYDSVVELDRTVSKRVLSEPKRLLKYIEDNFIGLEIPVADSLGNTEIIEFAKENETTSKNGKSHPVLGELAYTKGDTRKQVIVNAKEVIEESSYDPVYSSAVSEHGWLDENGWESRKTYVLAKDGMIYEAYLKIAKTRDGRNLLYAVNLDINKGIAVDKGATQKRAAVLATMPYNKTLPQNSPPVNMKYSLSEDTHLSDKAISKNNDLGFVEDEVMTSAKALRELVANKLRGMKENGVAIPDDIKGNTAISNSSYDITEENTTICPRSLAAEAFTDAVSEYLGRPLTVEEQIYISQDLQGRSLTPECTYCYVATDRKAYRAFLGEYIKQRDSVIEKLKGNPNADAARSGELYKEFLGGRKDTNPMYNRFKMWVDAYRKGTPMVEASHLANIEKLMGDINSEFGAELKPQITDAMKYAQSASWAKKRVSYVAYDGHILKWKQSRIDKLNSHYGLRMYSFSDYHPAFVLENMQMITDAAVRGLKMLAYTKDTDFVEIFAPSGMNINISTFGFESGGNVYENNIIGAEWEKAKKLRAENPNVGITFVATNDTIVEWALEQDWIDVVIPYHLVRTGAEVAKAFNYHNYTDESSDAKDTGWTKGNDKKYIAPTEHNNDKATYLAALQKNHLKPRFSRFIDNPNYMKLVNECRRPASESTPVQPKFGEEAIDRTLAKLQANGYYQPVGGSVDRMYEIAAEVAENMTRQIAPVYSLTHTADTQTYGTYNIKGKDVALDIGPVRDDIPAAPQTTLEAPVRYSLGNEDIGPEPPESIVSKGAPGEVNQNVRSGDKERKWVRTSTESEAVDRKILPDDLDQDLIHYQPISNKRTLGNANARFDQMGYEASISYLNGQFANNKVTLDDIALGERLIQEAVKRGDTKAAADLIMDISILGTELGQKVQALSIIKRLTPEGQLKMLKRTIERGKAKKDKAYEGVDITQEISDKILNVYDKDGTYDQNKLNKAVEEAKRDIAKQMKVTAMDKINAWRYLSMLGNPKTHIRNIVSNVAMRGTVAVKNAVARTAETVVDAFAKKKGKHINRTKTWIPATKDVRNFAKQTAMDMRDIISGDSKYSEDSSVKDKRRIFKSSIINVPYEFNSNALSEEDWWFSRPAFIETLSEFLTANGIRTEADIKSNPDIVNAAKLYATKQAEIATFRQRSWLASQVSRIEKHNNVTDALVGAIMPFKKTPINIAKTALNYSPLGFVKSVLYDASKVKKGEMDASELIDNLAQNFTGTALTLVGYCLAQAGFINGAGEDDKESEYDYQLGEQAYSINIGDSTFSLSWLSPVAMPLFVGVNAYEQLELDKEWNADVVVDTLAQTLDPLSEMSFLSGLNDVLSSYESGMGKFAGTGQAMVQNYISQFVPTLSSQIAQVTDDTKRSTKASADSSFRAGEELLNSLKYKIPGLRQTLEPATDIWGNEVKQTENVWARAAETFIAPWAKKEDISTAVDDEIKDLYSKTGIDEIIPSIPKNTVTYDNEKFNMSASGYTNYKKIYGQTAYALLEELFETDSYYYASDTEKAEMISKVYDYARDEAKRKFLRTQGKRFTNATKDGNEYYKENAIKGAIHNDMTLEEYDVFVNSPRKYKFLQSVNVSVSEYNRFDEDTKAVYDWASANPKKYRFLKSEGVSLEEWRDLANYAKDAYDWAYANPNGHTLSKAITDNVVEYRQYTGKLDTIKADKDKNGKSISGSKKTKVWDYISGLDIDDGAKYILFKKEYPSDDTYNYEIVEYLNSRDDLSYREMETILEELGFKVSKNGVITWD